MRSKAFLLKTVLLWCVIGAVLVECKRQKKDVHHMIILHEEKRPAKSHNRHKNHHHSHKTRNKSKHSQESFETSSSEESARHKYKSKSKRHPYKPHRYYSDSKWRPISSQELLGNNHLPPVFPGIYPKGQLQFSQAVPMEITTPFSMPPFSFEATLYPPVANTQAPLEGYKPFDYSVLEPQHSHLYPIQEATVGYELTPTTERASFSIVMNSSTENVQVNEEGKASESANKNPRSRGTSRFRMRKKNKN